MRTEYKQVSSICLCGRIRGRHQCASAQRFERAGFTVVELLIVIAIIAVLAAIMLPALNRSMEQGRSIHCLNNLKQLQLCWNMYADDNEEELPPNYFNFNPGLNVRTSSASSPNNVSWCPGNPRVDLTTANIENGKLYPYNRSALIYRCPSDRSSVEDANGNLMPKPRTRSYNMSASANSDPALLGMPPNGIPFFKRFTDILNPSPERLFVLIDENENVCWDAQFGLYPANSRCGDYWFDQPSDRHNMGANISFADGHVEHWRWAFPKIVESVPQRFANSQDLKDLRRLQAVMKAD
ncbi:MAG: prepilin-type N-terminal cleavage/methylation domain-containing protein [Verrucomicrobiota bacterium]